MLLGLRRPTFVFLASTAVAAAGCSHSTTTSTTSTGSNDTAATSEPAGKTAASANAASDPCAVLSRAEVGAVLKGSVSEPQRNGERCTWMTDPGNLVTIEVDATDGRTMMSGARGGAAAIGASAPNVAGVGEEAFYGAGDSMLYAREGDRFVAVDLRGVQRPRGVGPPLAKAALAHLRR